MPMGDDLVGELIFTDICDVVKERPQCNKPSTDCARCPFRLLLAFDESIDIMHADFLGLFSIDPLEENAHITAIVHRDTGAWLASSPVPFISIDFFLCEHLSPPVSGGLSVLQPLTLVDFPLSFLILLNVISIVRTISTIFLSSSPGHLYLIILVGSKY
jgi:hypothetical protein